MTPRKKRLTQLVVVRMEPALRKRLEELARADRRWLSEYIRVVLERAVADEETRK